MIIAIVILSVLVLAETGFIFWLLKVLKNTFSITENLVDIAQGKSPRAMQEAYDGKYYPATVIATVHFNAEQEMTITDFSRYESHKVVCFSIHTPQSINEYYQCDIESLGDEAMEEASKPVIFKNVVVYAPREGMWTWKPAE
jgi:hypothetical protein